MKAATLTQSYPAHQLAPKQRQALALKVIQNKEPLSAIARQSQVSRKFLYVQKNKAVTAVTPKLRARILL
jgi:DNA-binding phage protein